MVSTLLSRGDLDRARDLIRACGLSFEEGFDEMVGSHQDGRLVGVGARSRNVLKMVALDPEHRGGPLLGELVTGLLERGMEAGHESFFVFTRPDHAPTFEALNFALLASHGPVALLEYGGGFERWLEAHRDLAQPGRNGAVVMNANPFTLGHRHLVETAARQVDRLYVFVVREDRSELPFRVRRRLVASGVADLPNVAVLDTGSYAVSEVTFPSYFLKDAERADGLQMELDLALFAGRIAPYFGIVRRFAGTEPLCPSTALYGRAMGRVLPPLGVEYVEIERLADAEGPISASRVRAALRGGEPIAGLVPLTTLEALVP